MWMKVLFVHGARPPQFVLSSLSFLNTTPTEHSSDVPATVLPLCLARRPLSPQCSSGEEMPSPEEVHFKDSPVPFVLSLLSSLDGMVSSPALPTGPPSPLPGLLASGLNID